MVGRVVDGLYKDCEVHKLPDRNVLFIVTKDAKRIAINKENVVSIEDVTAEYSTSGKKTLMIMWSNFETSVIQFGTPSAQPASSEKVSNSQPKPVPQNLPSEKRPEAGRGTKSNKKKVPLPVWIGVVILLILCVAAAVFMFKKDADPLQEYKELAGQAIENIFVEVSASVNDMDSSIIKEEDILNSFTIVSYENESIEGKEYTFDVTARYTIGWQYYYFVVQVNGTIGDKENAKVQLIDQYTEDCEPGEEVIATKETISISEREEIAQSEAILALIDELQTNSKYQSYDVDSSRYTVGSIEQEDDLFTVYGTIFLHNRFGTLEDVGEFTIYVSVDSRGNVSSARVFIEK